MLCAFSAHSEFIVPVDHDRDDGLAIALDDIDRESWHTTFSRAAAS